MISTHVVYIQSLSFPLVIIRVSVVPIFVLVLWGSYLSRNICCLLFVILYEGRQFNFSAILAASMILILICVCSFVVCGGIDVLILTFFLAYLIEVSSECT